jgi:16S rRNA (cytosine967-C5)-methyltransferase
VSRIENQKRLFLELMAELRPHWHRQANQPQHLAHWLGRHRAGSRDRKLYRELAYTAWRTVPRISELSDDDLVCHVASRAERTKATAGFIDAYQTVEAPSQDSVLAMLPEWVSEECPDVLSPSHSDLLLQRAPLWIRLQTSDSAAVADELDSAGISFKPSAIIPQAWRIEADAPLQSTRGFLEGLFEIQDIGSQSLLHALPGILNGRWLDACAGAGGKTLQLAQRLSSAGEVIAHDIRRVALEQLSIRAQRARMQNVTVDTAPTGLFDGVLVDAPCSGSGTWRRSPHLKWSTSRESIRQSAEQQIEILNQFSASVKPNGLLIYATCSLCRTENQNVASAFLAEHSNFAASPLHDPRNQGPIPAGQLAILPADLDSDAYFMAAFKRIEG